MSPPLHQNTQELESLLTAAARAEAKFEWKAAAELHTRALEIIANATPGDMAAYHDKVVACDIHDRRSECYRMIGDFAAELADLERLAALAQDLGDLPRQVKALTEQVWSYNHLGKLDKSLPVCEDALNLARQAGDRRLESIGLYALGNAYRWMGKFSEAREVLDQGYEIASETGNHALEASILREMANLKLVSCRADEGRRDGLAALGIFRRLSDREGEADTLIILGALAQDLAQRRQYEEHALAIFEAIGNLYQQGIMWNNLGYFCLMIGLYHRAGVYLERLVPVARTYKWKLLLAYALDNLAAVYLAQGDLQRARALTEETLVLTRENGDILHEANCYLTLGQIELEDNCASEALAAFQAGVEIYNDVGSRETVMGLAWMVAAQLALGEVEAACQTSERAVSLLEAGIEPGNPPELIWWYRYKALENHSECNDQLSVDETWEALDRARQAMLVKIEALSDNGLRRNYFNKIAISHRIVHEWTVGAAQRNLPLSPLTDHLGGEGNLQVGLNRMSDIGVRLGTRRETGDLPPFIMDEIIELTGGDRTALLLFDEDGERREVFSAGFAGAEEEQVARGEFPEEMAALIDGTLRKRVPLLRYRQAGEDGGVVYIGEMDNWAYTPERTQRSLLCAPLIATGKLIGLVYCELDAIYGFFTQQDRDLLAVLANQAAMAVENANWVHTLEGRVEARTAELQAEIARRKLAEEHMRHLAITDPLTGILNRRHFFELAEKELERTTRYKHPLTIVLFDIDHFKKVNDTYGHLAGDQVLIKLTNFSQSKLRSVDIIARYGGEEFVILMPDTDCNAAEKLTERLRQMVAETPMHLGPPNISITLSLGIACWDGDGEMNIKALVDSADQALYHSKRTGRNRLTVWSKKLTT